MSYKVDNAIILAAGTSSRFAPLSFEKPKGLTLVNNEILIERQISQLREVGIQQIVIVVGYKKEEFYYLKDKYNVVIKENKDFLTRNNHSSIWTARDYINNSYICSSDNYFSINPFESIVDDAYYSAVFSKGETDEWCICVDNNGYINDIKIGGKDSWYMLGHTFWNQDFSKKFLNCLNIEYDLPSTQNKLWEHIFIDHLSDLRMKVRKYPPNTIFEFDTFEELREFDKSYFDDSRSLIIKKISKQLNCLEKSICNIRPLYNNDLSSIGFSFSYLDNSYLYYYQNDFLLKKS